MTVLLYDVFKQEGLSNQYDVIDATLGASGLWLGTRTGADGTTTLAKSFFGRSPWLHGQQVSNQKDIGLFAAV